MFQMLLLIGFMLAATLLCLSKKMRFKTAMVAVLAMFMALPAYGWGGDGFLLPFRGARVGKRCAEGRCIIQGPRRQAAAGMYQAGDYGHWQHRHAAHGSAGQTGSYGSAGQTGSYAPQVGDTVAIVDSSGNTVYGTIVESKASEQPASAPQCDCENCIRNRSSQSSVDDFKDKLTSLKHDDFKSKVFLVRKSESPGILLAAK